MHHHEGGVGRPPVACTLGLVDGSERMRRWKALADIGQPTTRRVGHRLEVRYLPAAGVREELEALAVAERACCPFVTWRVDPADGQVVLHVAADPNRPQDVAPLVALFAPG